MCLGTTIAAFEPVVIERALRELGVQRIVYGSNWPNLYSDLAVAGLYEYEHDQQVLEFYDQPPAIKLIYHAKNGRQVGVWHTPDYFVLRADGIGWEE